MKTAIKAGARHSGIDQGHIQEAHDRLVKAGAQCVATKAWTPPLAIKARADGKIEGLLVRYSDASQVDLELDFFDKNTNLGVRDGDELPVLWHHNLDPEKRGIIGKGQVSYTPKGLWFQSWLNRRDEYERYILKMIELNKAGYSGGASDIVRQPTAGKARRVTKFILVEGSVTPTPMDPYNVVSLKSFMAGGADPRGARILRELRLLEEDRLLDLELDLDELEENETRKARILRELKALEA